MTNNVLLNNVDHYDLRVVTGHTADFADNVNQVLIFPTEFERVQREYPIFFRKDEEDRFQSVAILGLDRDENLFLDGAGWRARYVPAVQRRGPFSIALRRRSEVDESSGEPMIHVDLDHPRISRERGEAVFLPHGGNSAYLEQVSEALRVIYTGLEASAPMFAAFAELDLIQPVAVEIKLSDTERYDVPDLHTIARDRFAALDGAALERLHRAGHLAPALWAMSSVANVDRLIELKLSRRGDA